MRKCPLRSRRKSYPPRFAWCEAAGGSFDLSGDSNPLSKLCLPLDGKETGTHVGRRTNELAVLVADLLNESHTGGSECRKGVA